MPSFKAKVQAKGPNKAWSFVDLPLDVEKEFGTKGRVSAKATLGRETFHTSIFPNGDGTHHLMFNKAMQKASGAADGDTVAIKLERDKGRGAGGSGGAESRAQRRYRGGRQVQGAERRPAGGNTGPGYRPRRSEETQIDRSAKTVKMVLAGKKRPSD